MSELTPRVRELLLALCEELLPDEDLVSLAGVGGSKKGRITRVASAAGAATYGVPIGTIITADMKQAAQNGIMPTPGKGTNGLKPATGMPSAAKPGGLALPKAPSGPKDPASTFNADATKLQATVTHPRVPGAKVYAFSDGTGVMEDARGNRSKRQNLDLNALKAKGWNVQEHNDDPNGTPGSVTGSGNGGHRTGGPKSNFEKSEETLKLLATSTPKADNKQADALMHFETAAASVNAAMRTREEPGEQNLNTIDGLRSLLGNSKTTSPVTVHKGMSFASIEERDSFVQTSLRPGTAFTDRGFSVASANRDNAMLHADNNNADNPGIVLNVAIPEGSRAASINAATGKDNQDHDVLLPDGARFKINSVNYDAGGRPVADAVYVDPLLPAHERAAAEEDPALTPDQKIAQHDSRFSWSPKDIELDDIPLGQESTTAPGAPGAVATGRVGGTQKGLNAKAAAKKPTTPGTPKPATN